jgi:hypothetical protein
MKRFPATAGVAGNIASDRPAGFRARPDDHVWDPTTPPATNDPVSRPGSTCSTR